MIVDLHRHGRHYAAEYPPHGNSDHLPMAWAALVALGATQERQNAFAAAYLPRLVTLPADDPHCARQERLLAGIAARGIAAVVSEHLPRFVSGWYRAAYHPLIRLAYGVAFREPGEVAAGLSYLESCGASPRVAALARQARPTPEISALDLFRRAEALGAEPDRAAAFDTRADAALAMPQMADLAVVTDDNLRQMSRAALSAFASTHDFFALHLVTASHAFRILRPYAGPEADAMLNLGLLAGYLAIGAPPIQAAPAVAGSAAVPSRPRLLDLCRDEHDVKIAWSAWAQAEHWQDPAYLTTVEGYLSGR